MELTEQELKLIRHVEAFLNENHQNRLTLTLIRGFLGDLNQVIEQIKHDRQVIKDRQEQEVHHE